MNTIPEDQLQQKQLDRLAAQRQLYSDAKRVQAIQIILVIPAVVIWAILVARYPGLQVYAASWGIGLALLDVLVFARVQRYFKERAAKIQELFDCDVLRLEWSVLKAGRRPDAETILEASSRYGNLNNSDATLQDWYPREVGKLPIHLARIICQRINCWWDAQLRQRYAVWVLTVGMLLGICVLLVGLIGGLTLEKFVLAVLAPLLPAAVLGIRQIDENLERAKVAYRLKQYSEDLWEKAISGGEAPEELAAKSRNLQDAIYDNRRFSPLIFDWIYQRLRTRQEEQANKGAKDLVEQAQKALAK